MPAVAWTMQEEQYVFKNCLPNISWNFHEMSAISLFRFPSFLSILDLFLYLEYLRNGFHVGHKLLTKVKMFIIVTP